MHVKQYSSLGHAIFDRLGNSGRKDPDIPCSHAKKIRIRNLRFRKIHFRERFRKAPFWGPSVFKKLRIRADTCDRSYVSGVEKLRFRKDPGTCARSLNDPQIPFWRLVNFFISDPLPYRSISMMAYLRSEKQPLLSLSLSLVLPLSLIVCQRLFLSLWIISLLFFKTYSCYKVEWPRKAPELQHTHSSNSFTFTDKKNEKLTAGSDEKTQRSPTGIHFIVWSNSEFFLLCRWKVRECELEWSRPEKGKRKRQSTTRRKTGKSSRERGVDVPLTVLSHCSGACENLEAEKSVTRSSDRSWRQRSVWWKPKDVNCVRSQHFEGGEAPVARPVASVGGRWSRRAHVTRTCVCVCAGVRACVRACVCTDLRVNFWRKHMCWNQKATK